MDSLIEILSSLHPDIDFTTATGLIEDGILDSFDIITLVAEIDDVFDVQIPAEELVPENFNTVQDLYNLIKRLEDD